MRKENEKMFVNIFEDDSENFVNFQNMCSEKVGKILNIWFDDPSRPLVPRFEGVTEDENDMLLSFCEENFIFIEENEYSQMQLQYVYDYLDRTLQSGWCDDTTFQWREEKNTDECHVHINWREDYISIEDTHGHEIFYCDDI